jgi:hypothetical protein
MMLNDQMQGRPRGRSCDGLWTANTDGLQSVFIHYAFHYFLLLRHERALPSWDCTSATGSGCGFFEEFERRHFKISPPRKATPGKPSGRAHQASGGDN